MALILDPIILFITVSAVIVLLIIVLVVADYQLKKRRALERESIEYRYSKRFTALKQAKLDTFEKIGSADKLARDFLIERFGISVKADYSQLVDFFISRGKTHILPFCQTMIEVLYSGEPLTASSARLVMISLESMLRREGMLSSIKEAEENKEKNMIAKAADYIQGKIEAWKIDKVKKQTASQAEVKEKQRVLAQEQKELQRTGEPMLPIPKKLVIVPKDAAKSNFTDKPEYRYVESIDMLDRIKGRIKSRKTV
jgi:hypothetical protein